MRAHRQLDHFRRQVEEGRVHLPQHDHRPFGEAGHFFQQPLIRHQFQTGLAAHVCNPLKDARAPVGPGQDHMALALELLLVIRPGFDRVRTTPVNAVSFGLVAALYAANFKGHNHAIQQADDPLQRAHPAQVPVRSSHRFRPVEGFHDLRNGLGDHVLRIAPGRRDIGHIEVALLRIGDDLGLVNRCEARAAQEARNRLLGRTDFRALLLFAHIGRTGIEPFDHGRQPARAGHSKRGFPVEARILQALRQRGQKVRLRLRLHARRDFLGKEFKQQFGHGVPAGRCFAWVTA